MNGQRKHHTTNVDFFKPWYACWADTTRQKKKSPFIFHLRWMAITTVKATKSLDSQFSSRNHVCVPLIPPIFALRSFKRFYFYLFHCLIAMHSLFVNRKSSLKVRIAEGKNSIFSVLLFPYHAKYFLAKFHCTCSDFFQRINYFRNCFLVE